MKADILAEVQRLIDALELHPDPAVRADVTALLQGIDAVHRTALTHLVDAIRGMAGDAFVNRLAGDPAIRLLLMSYELVAGDRPSGGSPLLQVGVRRAQRPAYRRVCDTADIVLGQIKAVDIEGQPILIANVDGEFHAVTNRCGDTPLPLQFGTLEGAELRCSWHGCRYDVRTGKRCDGGSEQLGISPVAVEN